MRTPTSDLPRERQPAPEPSITSHILVATKGCDTVSPEVRVARALADRHRSVVDVLSVVAPVVPPPLISDVGLAGSIEPEATQADIAVRRQRIREELARAGRSEWNSTVVAGWPVDEILAVARRVGATLIVLGIGRHAPIDRLMGSETALQVVKATDIPVLAVARDADGVPRHAVAAVDFSDESVAAAHLAADLLGSDGELLLAHVRPNYTAAVDPDRPVDLYAAGAQQGFDALVERLVRDHTAPPDVEHVIHHGDAASEILKIADIADADIIAVGARTHSRMHRLMLGSVAARLLRNARCSVLVLPANAERARRGYALPLAARATLPDARQVGESV